MNEQEIGDLQVSEARLILMGILRNLENVKAQRRASGADDDRLGQARALGEIWGLEVAIQAIRRRLR